MSGHYDICIVGAGTIGSPAAGYVKEALPNINVLLIGPTERKDRSSIDIHGSYYDKGRITRVLDSEPVWAELGRRSIARYRDIEHKSGVKFYEEGGFIRVGKTASFLADARHTAARENVPVRLLSPDEMQALMPLFSAQTGEIGVYVEKDAGYVNIREMVQAHRKLAKMAGCDVEDDVIKTITPPSANEEYYRLETDAGRVYYSRKVLLATGAFTSCRNLLPPGVVPDVTLKPIATILVELREEDAVRMRRMPSMSVRHPDSQLIAYMLPPITYPDGKTYLKVGQNTASTTVPLQTADEIHRWFNRTQVGPIEQRVHCLAKDYFPAIPMERYRFDHCVVTSTPHGYPFIDMLTPTFGVVVGGNGRAAKCADELGRIAARMIVKGAWDSDLPKETFRFINRVPTSGSKL